MSLSDPDLSKTVTDYHQTMAYLNFGKEGRGVEVVGWGVGGRWAPSPEKK